MKVAIMGAGMAGLSCAFTLIKHGITPAIFEKRRCVGDRFINAESMFHILNRPVQDSLPYLKEIFGIHLQPVTEVHKIVIHSQNETGCINGDIGYTNIRGRHDRSYEMQLQQQVKADIEYNSDYEYEELCKKFDVVVLATGDAAYASQLGNFRSDLSCTVRGATIEGQFETDIPHVWFDYEIIPKGYGWIIPYSQSEANLVMLYPDYPSTSRLNINAMWDRFFERTSKEFDQAFKITDKFEVTKYLVGICERPKVESTYFVGNCFGAISPGLGFGQFTSILTGIHSAYDICGLGSYEELVKPLFKNYEHSLVLRRFLESLTDEDLDMLVKSSSMELFQKIADHVCDRESQSQVLRNATPFMKIFNKIKEGQKEK
ncbi:NAD(P)/FAD-dependent oxidoreductase [Oscillospiraceae bacterium MB08-C2-2]|nr:NAD(P)/FAD-dependent oxidoreductase [Oscillospiraceae bacterium MB08-C2-2]